MAENGNVVVVGGGMAGLAAAAKLAQAGVSVSILEARERLGGRVLTVRDSPLNAPLELGAEFIHGMPPEIWVPLQSMGVKINEVKGEPWCFEQSALKPCNFFGQIDSILDKMDDREPDVSFIEFLQQRFPNTEKDPKLRDAKQRALNYVVGFNAADPQRVGVHWLVQGMHAEEQIAGERAFRCAEGYQSLIEWFQKQLAAKAEIRTGSVVEAIRWKSGHAELTLRGNEHEVLTAERVLITVPLSILKADPSDGGIEFTPTLPATKLASMKALHMGKIMRVVLKFKKRFWDSLIPPLGNGKSLSNMSFLFSQDEWFPTWWTTMPEKLPIITGWAPFHAAERLIGQSEHFVADRALGTLCKLLAVEFKELQTELDAVYFHDWDSDPFSRGAYSYGGVGADGAQRALGAPVENTLFFAGEATDVTGHNGTVHGAIASGYRAADEILKSQNRKI